MCQCVLHLFCLCQAEEADVMFWLFYYTCLWSLLNESRSLRIYEFNQDEKWPAWLKCNDSGVVVLSCW